MYSVSIRLRDRKVENTKRTSPDIIAAGDIGCMSQIAQGTFIPWVHTTILLERAYGGPCPVAVRPAITTS